VDGIQALGAIPVTLGDDVDVYCAAVFKWLLSGFGLAVWVVSDRALQMMQPAQRGYENPPPERKLRYSHWNYPGLFALAGSVELLDEIGWEHVHARVADNSSHLAGGLRSLGYTVATPDDACAGIVSFAVNDPALVSQMLEEREVFVAARGKFLRVSPHFYNTRNEIDRFLHVISEVAPPGP
jgi:selenocysteine lyase/cysteine desulfurase